MKEKSLLVSVDKVNSFEEYKEIIDTLIKNKNLNKLKFQPNYFEVCNNYWIIDKYIAQSGHVNPEHTPNTFSAYAEAIKNDYTIALTVQLLDDGNIVCFSHKNISKVVSHESGYLNNLKLDEVKNIQLNDKKETIPTLEEALNYIAGKVPVIIEINNDAIIGKFEDKVLHAIKKYITEYKCYNKIAIMSINPYSLQYCFNEFPYITRILKSGNFEDKMYGSIPTRKLKKLKLYKITNADFISYNFTNLPCTYIDKCKPVGLIAHTIHNQKEYNQITTMCDNIIFANFMPKI